MKKVAASHPATQPVTSAPRLHFQWRHRIYKLPPLITVLILHFNNVPVAVSQTDCYVDLLDGCIDVM